MTDKDSSVNVEGGTTLPNTVYFSTKSGYNLRTTILPRLHGHTIGWLAGFLFKKKKKKQQSVLLTDFLCVEFLSPWNYIKSQPLKAAPVS